MLKLKNARLLAILTGVLLMKSYAQAATVVTETVEPATVSGGAPIGVAGAPNNAIPVVTIDPTTNLAVSPGTAIHDGSTLRGHEVDGVIDNVSASQLRKNAQDNSGVSGGGAVVE